MITMQLTWPETLAARRCVKAVYPTESTTAGLKAAQLMDWCALAPVGVEFEVIGLEELPEVPQLGAIVTRPSVARPRRKKAIKP